MRTRITSTRDFDRLGIRAGLRARFSGALLTSTLFLSFFFVFLAAPAHSLAIITSNSGLDAGQGCTAPNCFFSEIFSLDASAPVSGTFDLTGSTLTFSIDLAAASFSGTDGPVTGVDFSNVNYSGSVAVASSGPGMVTITDQLSAISGTLTPVGAGSATPFNLTGVNTVGNCTTAGNTIQCGLTFGSGTGFPIDVNGNTRYFNHFVDFTAVVPEPGTALLLGAGLTILGIRRGRDRIRA